jgi:hypothetical protein
MLDDPLRAPAVAAAVVAGGSERRRVLMVNDSAASVNAQLVVVADEVRVFDGPVTLGTTGVESAEVELPVGAGIIDIHLDWENERTTNSYVFAEAPGELSALH